MLPSPNGSAIAHAALGAHVDVVSACLRDAAAAVRYLGRYDRVGLVPTGERWPDGTMRPAYEDWVGVGVVAAGLVAAGASGTPDAVASAT